MRRLNHDGAESTEEKTKELREKLCLGREAPRGDVAPPGFAGPA
jgi:hypothetical protein